MEPPTVTPVDDLSEDARKAAFELLAEAFRQGTDALFINLGEVTYEGQSIGGYEVTVRKVD